MGVGLAFLRTRITIVTDETRLHIFDLAKKKKHEFAHFCNVL